MWKKLETGNLQYFWHNRDLHIRNNCTVMLLHVLYVNVCAHKRAGQQFWLWELHFSLEFLTELFTFLPETKWLVCCRSIFRIYFYFHHLSPKSASKITIPTAIPTLCWARTKSQFSFQPKWPNPKILRGPCLKSKRVNVPY